MTDLAITRINQSTQKYIDAKVEMLSQQSELYSRLWGKKKVHGGSLLAWFEQKTRPDPQSYTAGGVWVTGDNTRSEELQLAWAHFADSFILPYSHIKMNKATPTKIWDLVKNQVDISLEGMKYGFSNDLWGDGTAVAITKPDGVAGTRTPVTGMVAICTPDGEYAGHTPVLATDTKMWHQPRVFDFTSGTTPSHGDASGYSGVASWDDLADLNSPFNIFRTIDRFTQWGIKKGHPITYVAVDDSTMRAVKRAFLSRQWDISSGTGKNLGGQTYKYSGVEIGYEPSLDDQSVCRMFGIPEADLEMHAIEGMVNEFLPFARQTNNVSDAMVAAHLLSYQIKAKRRDCFCMAYNLPRA